MANQPILPNTAVDDSQYADIKSLLLLLAEQLQISVDISHKDFDYISDFCLDQIDEKQNLEEQKARLIQSLQYYDRFNQCTDNIVNTLRHLATELEVHGIGSIDIDFSKELLKIHSLFNEEHAREICQHLKVRSNQEKDLIEKHWMRSSGSTQSGDVDFF